MEVSELEIRAKQDNRIAGDWLLYIAEREQETLEKERDILFSSAPIYTSIPKNKHEVGNPTESKALKLEKLRRSKDWIKLIRAVEENLSIKQKIFLELRRKYRDRRGPHGWAVSVQWEYAQEMARRTGKKPKHFWIKHQNTFTGWWNRIVDITVREAIRRGLL